MRSGTRRRHVGRAKSFRRSNAGFRSGKSGQQHRSATVQRLVVQLIGDSGQTTLWCRRAGRLERDQIAMQAEVTQWGRTSPQVTQATGVGGFAGAAAPHADRWLLPEHQPQFRLCWCRYPPKGLVPSSSNGAPRLAFRGTAGRDGASGTEGAPARICEGGGEAAGEDWWPPAAGSFPCPYRTPNPAMYTCGSAPSCCSAWGPTGVWAELL